MENPTVFSTLIESMKDQGKTTEEIERFRQHWLTLGPHDSLSCPLCFIERNEISAIKPLPAKDGFEPVKCTVCKEHFSIPID